MQSTSAYNDNQWHHVVLQRADGKLRLMVDGTEVRIYRRALSTADLNQIRLTNKPIRSQLGPDLPFSSIN